MIKIKNKNIKNIDIYLWRRCMEYLFINRFKLYVLFSIGLLLHIFIYIPYLNLIFSKSTVILIIAAYGAILLKINGKIYLILALSLLVLALCVVLFKNYDLAEELGNIIYIFLIIGTLRLMKQNK